MSIRIYNDGLAGTAASETSRAQELSRVGSSGKTSSSSSAGEDQVAISSVSETLSTQSAVRSARVQDLTAVYQSGNYQVNSTDVSRALINNALGAGATESSQ